MKLKHYSREVWPLLLTLLAFLVGFFGKLAGIHGTRQGVLVGVLFCSAVLLAVRNQIYRTVDAKIDENIRQFVTETAQKSFPTCQFLRPNNERCKRTVARGQKFCWQHAHGLLAAWRSLTGNQTVVFLMAVVGMAATFWFGFHPYMLKIPIAQLQKPAQQPELKASVEPSNRATKGETSKGNEKAAVPKSTSLGVHKPTETLVIPPNSSAVISPGAVSPKDMSELDRMQHEAVQAGMHLSTEPDKLVLHDLFLTDFSSEDNNSVSLLSGFVIQNNETKVITHIEYRIVRQLTLGTKVLLLYILPTAETPHLCVSLADHYDVALGDFLEGRTEAVKLPGDSEQMTTQDIVLSKRIFVYHETYVSPQQAIDSSEAFKKKGISVILRSSDYLENRRLQARVKLLEKRRKPS